MIAHVLAAAVLVAVPTEEERLRGAFFGSLVADALCLGSHYEYDAANNVGTVYASPTVLQTPVEALTWSFRRDGAFITLAWGNLSTSFSLARADV